MSMELAMDPYELLLRVLARAEPLLPYLLAAAVLTALPLPLFLVFGRSTWVDRRRFGWAGLLLGLDRWSCLRLACAWSKLLLLIGFLTIFHKMELEHYLLFLIPGVLECLSLQDVLRIPGRLIWLALETVVLFSCNMVCGYIHDTTAQDLLYVLYACMALFTALFGIYLFLTELNDISEGRSASLDDEWGPGAGGDDAEGE